MPIMLEIQKHQTIREDKYTAQRTWTIASETSRLA